MEVNFWFQFGIPSLKDMIDKFNGFFIILMKECCGKATDSCNSTQCKINENIFNNVDKKNSKLITSKMKNLLGLKIQFLRKLTSKIFFFDLQQKEEGSEH